MDQLRAGRPFERSRSNPLLVIGPLLIAGWWVLAWGDFGEISHYYFFPLWLGYILTVDGLVQYRTGESPLTRLGWRYPLVFVISAPFWWMFELFNERLTNWTYLTPWDYGLVGRTIIGTFSFSTVIPAVLTTAELISSYLSDRRTRVRLPLNARRLAGFHIAGWLMLAAMLLWPEYLFPLCWLSVLFIIDPVARALGAITPSSFLETGRPRPLFSLALAGLVCGWFWEMWNILAMPKWVYTVPHVGFLKVWEMPLLGYGGYIPFAFEVFAYYALITALLPWWSASSPDRPGERTEIDPDEGRFL